MLLTRLSTQGLFTLPPSFRKYQVFVSYGWGGFACVATLAFAYKYVSKQHADAKEAKILRAAPASDAAGK